MNSHSQWRYHIAKKLAPLWAQYSQVAAVILGGSTARGHADKFSDVEIGVFWHEAPTDTQRETVIQQANADLIRLYAYDPDEQVWCDDFMMGRNPGGELRSGILIEAVHYRVEFMEMVLHQVIEENSTRLLSHNLISALLDGIVFHGDDLITDWRNRTKNYPRDLSVAMIHRYGVIDHFWRWRMYLHRNENLPLLYHSFTHVQEHLLHMLLALNGVYYFGFKWLNVVDNHLSIKPDNFLARLREVYTFPPEQGALQLQALVEESFDLIETHRPEVNIAWLREIFRYQRPVWDAAPPSISE